MALVKVRPIGVVPQTIHPRKPVGHYGWEASLFLTNLLKGESVYFVMVKIEQIDTVELWHISFEHPMVCS